MQELRDHLKNKSGGAFTELCFSEIKHIILVFFLIRHWCHFIGTSPNLYTSVYICIYFLKTFQRVQLNSLN